jgi:leucyl aminopeptidase
MKTELSISELPSHVTPLLAVPVFEGDSGENPTVPELDELDGGVLARAIAEGDFRGREEDELLVYRAGEGHSGRLLFLGAGKRADADAELLRRIAGRAVRKAEALGLGEVSVATPGPALESTDALVQVQALGEGLVLAAWNFRELHTDRDESAPRRPVETGKVVVPEGSDALDEALWTGTAFATGENLARTLQSRPGNVATPTHLAEVARGLASQFGFAETIMGPEELEAEKMGALLSVARGSDEEPRLIVLEHWGGDPDEAPIALVGKGLTFDTGGISMKPASGMESMKFDMSGGAAVLGAMHAIGSLDLPVNVVAVVPSSENMVNGSATKPGDVIRTRAGKTVEVINTDAEGRLILADALSWVIDRYEPAAVVDCATLTGACVVALGHHAAAILGTDEGLIQELREAGDLAGERCWPLPLWKPYRKQLESDFADLKNVGGRPAGTITAAWFLSEFVGEAPWAHLDIAGTAYGETDLPYRRKGGFGFPTRLLLEWVRRRSA